MKYIGMDAHSSTCTFCVVDEKGQELDNTTLQTNGRLLVRYVRGIGGKKRLTFEECELSQWLHTILKPEVDEMIVCNPVANRDYKKAKTDKLDAQKLAKLLRGGFLEPVYHDGSRREQFRSLMSGYEDMVQEGVRLKNQYKSLYRKSNGRRKGGTQVYTDPEGLKAIAREDLKFVGTQLYGRLVDIETRRKVYHTEIERTARPFKEIRHLRSIPGIGKIQAAKIVSQVIDPWRFATKYKYYSYCGLVRHQRESGGQRYGSKRIWGNRILKCVYKMAGHSALRGNKGMRQYYESLRNKGVSERNAYNAVCRKIAAISLSVWKKHQNYDAQRTLDGLTQKGLV